MANREQKPPPTPDPSPLAPGPQTPVPGLLLLAEIALVFAVFLVQGAVAVPDVNEPYYLGKAIHYWNPDWAQGDFFLDSKDSHEVFYCTFGWLSLWLAPPMLAWFGRVLTWGLLAWAWRRLSFAVLPRRWWSILTAAVLVCLVERCNMAGEWVVGGVEAKGFAFVLVFLGLEAVVQGRFGRAWLLMGAASAFHVLVGGWSAVALGLAWPGLGKDRPTFKSIWPAVLGGFVLSLPGLIPALTLNWGIDAETLRQANWIYVYDRLAHHLDLGQIPIRFIIRFTLLSVCWVLLCLSSPAGACQRRLRVFVAAVIAIVLAGAAIHALSFYAEDLGARLLRFYWFRLADIVVPMGVALEGTSYALRCIPSRPAWGKWALAVVVLAAGSHLGVRLARLPVRGLPRAFRLSHKVADYMAWRAACAWVADSGQVPRDARFITPVMAQTFKWYTGHGELANWKEIPQDAEAIVQWRRRIEGILSAERIPPWNESMIELRAAAFSQLGRDYGVEYLIAVAWPRMGLEVVYENDRYIVYRLPRAERPTGVIEH